MHKSFSFLKEPLPNKKKNIVFLDIDGVLQPYSADSRFNYNIEALPEYFTKKYNDDTYLKCNIYDLGAAYFDWNELALARVKQILRDFNAYLVISSAWRESVSSDCLKALFKLYDMDGYILDILGPGKKENMIKNYLTLHGNDINQYVVIDDDFMLDYFGLNFCHTYNIIDSTDHVYINNLFLAGWKLDNDLVFYRRNEAVAKILEEKIILDNKNISCFSIKFIKELNEYDILSIYNELNRYCEKNNVWCMLFKWNNRDEREYLLIKKNIFHKTEDFSFTLCSPINNFSSEKYFSKEKINIINNFV